MKCPYCGSDDVEVVKTWKMRNYTVTHYKCRACGGTFNHYSDASTGKEFILRSGRRAVKH
ncbi:hypothetical protein [Vulcanisaeta souniana]|uniref:hypothetical protein n=1 Tax=Vulcanisaeta souniana TaxID=164452 RepID=UPI0006CF44D0|nr:hypothetical protein [Vulcanisaeta souniana]